MVTLLLDTNVLAEAARPRPDVVVLERLGAAEGSAAMSSVTWQELRYGAERLPDGRRRTALAEFVCGLPDRFPVLPYDGRAADWHAVERARLEAQGLTRPFADGQIAAVAVTNGLKLITRNLADFVGFDGLRARSWWSAR